MEDRPDFLGWLRQVSIKGDPMSDADLVNHLSNNLVSPLLVYIEDRRKANTVCS